MRRWIYTLAAMFMVSLPALAEDRPVVVELFTSQGCSSCPAADRLMHDLAARDDIIALALHVDYWDYIGWADSFADPAYTARQRLYAKTSGEKMIYTPQMIVDGRDHVVGNRALDVAELIARHRATAPTVDIVLSRSGETLSIDLTPLETLTGPLLVQLVRYRPEETVKIKRGENAGKTLSYANIVTDLTELTTWNGRAPVSMSAPAPGDLPVVVLVQRGNGLGPVEAAARLR